MKRLLLLTLIGLTVILAGVLQGSAVHQDKREYSAFSAAYTYLYPETVPFNIVTYYPY